MSYCESCRYFRSWDDDSGGCHRYAPRPVRSERVTSYKDNALATLWPEVSPDDTCGEHAPH